MKKSYLAFDLGASSGRGIIGTLEDGKLSMKEIHRFKNFPEERNGHFFWNIRSLLNEIKKGIRLAYEADPEISSIGIDTWGVDYVFFRNGEIIRGPYNYRDPRTEGIPEEVHASTLSAEEMYAMTGIQDMSINTVYQLLAHKREFPEDFEGGKFLHIPDALAFLLTGDFSTEYTDASTGGLLDPNTRTWNIELLEKLGLPLSIFPSLVQPSTRSLPLKKSICEELGVPPIPFVKVGSHDTASAVASTPADSSKKWAYISSGTWTLLGAELPKPHLSAEAAKAHFTNEGGLNNTIRFLTNIMGLWLLQESKRTWNEAGNDITFPDMIELAKNAVPNLYRIDPNDSRFLQPCNMPARIREACAGQNGGAPMSDAQVLRCIYDSLTSCFGEKFKLLEQLLQEKFDVLHVLGGGTRDALLMQLTANAVGVPVLAGPVEATATGNLLSQMMADGALKNLSEARQVVKNSFEIKTFRPEK